MYECEYCGAKYTDKDIESEEIIECEALVKEDVYCGCREFKKIENDNLDITANNPQPLIAGVIKYDILLIVSKKEGSKWIKKNTLVF